MLYTDAELQEVAGRVHDIDCDKHCTPTPRDVAEARMILDAVTPMIAARVAVETLHDAANRLMPFSGIGLANGATRADVAQWLRARADLIDA
jgi:hypothetical protein